MHPVVTVMIGWLGALIFATGSLWFELAAVPTSLLTAAILERLPQLIPAIVAVYAILVLLTATTALIADIYRVHSRITNAPPQNRDLWISIFAGTGLSRLALRLIHLAQAESPADRIVVEDPFDPYNARHEILHLHQDWLSRVHFFTALAVLLGGGIFGLAEKYGLIGPFETPIATAPIFAGALGLIFLAVFSRLGVDTAAGQLVDAIAVLPFDRIDISLLQSIVAALQQYSHSGGIPDASSPSVYAANEAIARSLSRSHRSLEKTVAQLSKSAEVVANASRVLADQPRYLRDAGIDTGILPELHSVVERLATIIEGLPSMVQSTMPIEHGATTLEPTTFPAQPAASNDLIGELRRLLHDLE